METKLFPYILRAINFDSCFLLLLLRVFDSITRSIGVRTRSQFVCQFFFFSLNAAGVDSLGCDDLFRFLMDLIRWSGHCSNNKHRTHSGRDAVRCFYFASQSDLFESRVIEYCNFSHSISFSYRMTRTINSVPLPIRIVASMRRTEFCVCVS